MAHFIDQFEVILLDMMGTFMFNGDRLPEYEDYAGTYPKIGGSILSAEAVNAVICEICFQSEYKSRWRLSNAHDEPDR